MMMMMMYFGHTFLRAWPPSTYKNDLTAPSARGSRRRRTPDGRRGRGRPKEEAINSAKTCIFLIDSNTHSEFNHRKKCVLVSV